MCQTQIIILNKQVNLHRLNLKPSRLHVFNVKKRYWSKEVNLVKVYIWSTNRYIWSRNGKYGFLSDITNYAGGKKLSQKKKNAKGRKNWLKGEHVHQNLEPTTLLELDHTNSHSYPRLLKFWIELSYFLKTIRIELEWYKT